MEWAVIEHWHFPEGGKITRVLGPFVSEEEAQEWVREECARIGIQPDDDYYEVVEMYAPEHLDYTPTT